MLGLWILLGWVVISVPVALLFGVLLRDTRVARTPRLSGDLITPGRDRADAVLTRAAS